MRITPVKTHPIVKGEKFEQILDKYVKDLKEQTVIVIASKVVAVCQGRVVPIEGNSKDHLVQKEAELFVPRTESKYDFYLTIKNNMIVANAGIDESNGNGYYVLWPQNPQQSVNKIREYLSKKFGVKNLGVIITDSKLSPLRWGVTGYALSYSGFNPLKNYIGQPDIFGRKLEMEQLNIADSLASAAVAVMGEGDEQTPIAIVDELQLQQVEFQDRNPTEDELKKLQIKLKDDAYEPLLSKAAWQKGKGM